MDIIIEKYRLTPTPQTEKLFDVYKKHIVEKTFAGKALKEEEKHEKEKSVAYGVTLSGAISLIIKWNLAEQNVDVTLKQYIIEYRKESDKVLKVLDSLTK